MSSKIPVRQNRPITRPTARKIENVQSVATRTRSKPSATATAEPSDTKRAVSATASSMAKAVDTAQTGPVVKTAAKRKREILAEVTDQNQSKTRSITTTLLRRRDTTTEKSVNTSKSNIRSLRPTTATTGTSNSSRIPPTRANVFPASRPPVFVPPTKEQQRQRENPAPVYEEEHGRVFKKRYTGPKKSDEDEERLVMIELGAPPAPKEDEFEEEKIAVEEEDEDEDITGLYDEIDLEDMDDPLMVAEYAGEITEYWKKSEKDNLPDMHYMSIQPELSWQARTVLVDWILQLHSGCPFNPESLFLTVNLLDRFCSRTPGISNKRYQLVALACFMIACKFEEVVCMSIAQLLKVVGTEFTADDIRKAERYVLKILNWELNYNDPRVRTLSKYLLEIGIFEHRLVAVPPSLLSASAYFLSRLCLGEETWTPNLIKYTTYRERELLGVAGIMLTYIARPMPQSQALHKKYASKTFLKASTFMKEWTLTYWPEGGEIDLQTRLAQIKSDNYDARIERMEREQDERFARGEGWDDY